MQINLNKEKQACNQFEILVSKDSLYISDDIRYSEEVDFEWLVKEMNLQVTDWLIEYCYSRQIENIGELLSIINSTSYDYLSVQWMERNHPQYPGGIRIVSSSAEEGIHGKACGWCRLLYSGNPIRKVWPKSPVFVSLDFYIKESEIKFVIKEMT